MPKKASHKTQRWEVASTLLQDFINRYQRTTGYVYRAGLLDFIDFIAGKRMRAREATTEDMAKYEAFISGYIADKKRKHTNDVIGYVRNLRERGIVPKTAHVRLAAVKEFLLRQGIVLSEIDKRDVKHLIPRGGRRTNIEHIDRENLSEIIHHFDARGRAWVLVLASSGMRIGEVLSMQWNDVTFPDRTKYPDKPVQIFVRDSKTGNSRVAFVTREAEQALLEWKKEVDNYRAFATKRSENLKNDNKVKRNSDDRVFPFSRTSCYAMWNAALEKSGHYNRDPQTKHVRMNIHRLRNFFSVQAAPLATKDVSEMLMGHHDEYEDAYRGQSPAKIEEAYRKAEPALTIGTTTPGMERQAEELEALKKENAALQERLQHVEQKQETLETVKARAHADPMYAELVARLEKMETEFKKGK
jgi:integrase